MTSTISASSRRRVGGRVLEQAPLTDRPDHRGRVVRADHGQLGDPVLMEQRDRVAHPAMSLDGDQ